MSLIEKALSKKEHEQRIKKSQGNTEMDDEEIFLQDNTPFYKKRYFQLLILLLSLSIVGTVFYLINFKRYISYYNNRNIKTKPKKIVTSNNDLKLSRGNISLMSKKNHISITKDNIIKIKGLNLNNSKHSLNNNIFNKNDYTIIAGTFKNKSIANIALKKFLKIAKDICPNATVKQEKTYFIIVCGNFKDLKSIIKVKNEIIDRGYKDIFILKKKKKQMLRKKLEHGKSNKFNNTKLAKRNIFSTKRVNLMLDNAYYYLKNEDFVKAMKLYDKILSIDPYNKDALINRSIICQKIGEMDIAERDLKKALQKYKNDPEVLNLMGVIYLKKKNFRKAKFCFEKAKNAIGMINLAVMYWQQNKLDEVYNYLLKAQRLEPENPYVYYYKWIYYSQINRQDMAKKAYNKSKRLAEEGGYFDLLKKLEKSE